MKGTNLINLPMKRSEINCKIMTGSGLLNNPELIFSILNIKSSNVLILTDDNVYNLYGNQLEKSLRRLVKTVTSSVIPSGERSKDINKLSGFIKPFLQKNLSRNTVIISIGGGVVTDIGGFISSILLRGLKSVYIPTTLLAQVDASIGGKTGVDLWNDNNEIMQKNMLGTIHNPSLVLCDIDTLKSLHQNEILNGLGEIVKYHIGWGSPTLSEMKIISKKDLVNNNSNKLISVILKCQKIKSEIVSHDPYEISGLRQKLNFGHTVGHAVEGACNGNYSHGQCVAIGISAAAFISLSKGLIDKKKYLRILNLIKSFNLPIVADSLKIEKVIDNLKKDKKDGKFVLINDIGKLITNQAVPEDLVIKSLENIIR
jgi:3-dehydroquinate synthase